MNYLPSEFKNLNVSYCSYVENKVKNKLSPYAFYIPFEKIVCAWLLDVRRQKMFALFSWQSGGFW